MPIEEMCRVCHCTKGYTSDTIPSGILTPSKGCVLCVTQWSYYCVLTLSQVKMTLGTAMKCESYLALERHMATPCTVIRLSLLIYNCVANKNM